MKSPLGLVVIGSLLVLALVSCEQPTAPRVPIQADATASSVAFFADRAAFTALFPDLPLEDFEKGIVTTRFPAGCPGPLDATSNNACFLPGDIKPGIQFNEDHPGSGTEIALVPAGFLGAPSKNIAANDPGNAFLITFLNGNVTATGMDLVSYFAADICQIDVFGASGLLVSTTAPCTNQGAFWGVTSAVPITQIRIFSPTDQFEGVDNIAFGAGVVAPVNHPPVANARGPYSGNEGSAVLFQGGASSDPDGDPLTYDWDFGDGTPHGAGVTPSHVYADNHTGGYTVTLKVTDPGGLTATASATATIDNVAPTVGPITAPVDPVEVGTSVTATANFTDPGTLDTHTGTIDWGDGASSSATVTEVNGSGSASGSHAYAAAGSYTVTLRVTDKDGGVGQSVFASIHVFQRLPPVAKAGGPYSGAEGSMVQFDGGGSSDPAGAPLTFLWSFGDGATGVGAAPSHSYADNGSYPVSLTVTAANGLANTAVTTAMISNVAPTVGLITAPVQPVEVGTSVVASANFTDPGVLDTHTGTIDWGDGTSSSAAVSEVNGSGSASGSHAYAVAGVYTVTLTVTDKDGGVGQSVFEFVVVFDTLAGFVTGGGWINSLPGSYVADPRLAGKATFGFVSRYQHGATTPSGNTEFNFRVAALHFHSTSYDWLVVSGSKVRFKGSGMINGAGDFAFQVSAVDGDLIGGPDTFRMTIWDKSTG
ncbi:MAG TPA: PKD domain-containing protein, partial [Acidimicrobiales bacterium]